MKKTLSALVIALGLVQPVGATHEDEIHTVRGISTPIYAESIVEHYRVPTEWGTIYGAVRRPVVPEGVKVPVILTYSPYNIQARPHNAVGVEDGTANYYVPRGYARALFDLVGTRESSGCYDLGGIAERKTGAAVVDFLGTRPWSNGKVGMIGGSYDGTTQYATAVEAPEHLTTIVPQVAIDRWFDYPFENGIRRFSGYGTPLMFDYGFGFAPPTDIAGDPATWAAALAGRVNPCERAQNQIRGYGFDPVYDEFWRERDYRSMVENVKASVMIEGGWLDSNVQPVGSTRFFQALPDNHPKRLVMGQWGHSAASFPDSNNVRHAWFDYWLLGLETGVMDLPRVDSQGGFGDRVQEDHWPPLSTREATLRLVPAGGMGIDELSLESSSTTWTDNDPRMTETTMFGNCGNSCIRFLGPELDRQVRITGTPFVDLEISSVGPVDAPAPLNTVSTQLAVVLYEQTGATKRAITRGMLNFRNRNGLHVSEDAINRQRYEVTLELDDTDWWVGEGARLGLAISSNNANVALFPDDDSGATNTLWLEGTSILPALRVPISLGHPAVGLPEPDSEA